MDEYNSTETTEVVDSGEQMDVVDSSTENHDFDMVDEPFEAKSEEPEKSDDGQDDAVGRQSADDNHAAKLARLKAERDAKRQVETAKKAFMDEFLSAGVVNPYTERPFESFEEYKEYGRKVKEAEQKARADRDGKTIEEIEEEDKVREIIRKAKEPKKDSQAQPQDFFHDDLIDFMEKHPEVDVTKLDNNPKFRKFVGSRYGKESLSALYDDYAELVHDAERSAKADTRNARSTGTGNNGGDRLTASQRHALDEWNEQNPEMKMTPSEYLHR